jgi:hypothetical protein
MSTSSKALQNTTQVPDYTPYTKGTSDASGRAFSYFMVGSMGLLTAAGAKATVSDFLTNMSASSDVLALAKVEVDLGAIPEGKNVIIKVRRCGVFESRIIYSAKHPEHQYSGAESLSSSVTALLPRSTRPTPSMSSLYVILKPTQSVSRSPNGLSCSASAPTWGSSRSNWSWNIK